MSKKRVAVIGAGPSGLAQLRAFQSAKAKGEDSDCKDLLQSILEALQEEPEEEGSGEPTPADSQEDQAPECDLTCPDKQVTEEDLSETFASSTASLEDVEVFDWVQYAKERRRRRPVRRIKSLDEEKTSKSPVNDVAHQSLSAIAA